MCKKASLIAVLALAGVAACGKSASEKFADSYCGEIAKCCAKAGISGNAAFCRMALSGGGYDAKAGDACLAEMKAQVAAGTFCDNLSAPSACNSVLSPASGNKKPGETCEVDSDCAASSDGTVACAGARVNGNWIYKCQVQKPGKAGDTPCVGTQDGAVLSYYTDPNATDVTSSGFVCSIADGVRCQAGTCVALVNLGGSCSSSSDCVRVAFCDTNATCAARAAAGAACDSTACVVGYYCPSSGMKQCTAKLGTGAQCSESAVCQSGMCSGNTCQPDLAVTMGLALLCAG